MLPFVSDSRSLVDQRDLDIQHIDSQESSAFQSQGAGGGVSGDTFYKVPHLSFLQG